LVTKERAPKECGPKKGRLGEKKKKFIKKGTLRKRGNSKLTNRRKGGNNSGFLNYIPGKKQSEGGQIGLTSRKIS